MNLDADDDLPVLTQVLRTADGRPPTLSPTAARGAGREHPAGEPHLDASPGGEPASMRALVIGTEVDGLDASRTIAAAPSSGTRAADPAHDIDTAGVRESRTVADPTATVADPRRIDVLDHDVFLRTSPLDALFATGLDEPPLIAHDATRSDGHREGEYDGPHTAAVSRDVPLVFRDRPAIHLRERDEALARRVRDDVLQQLGARIDTELDARIAQTLHAEVETALAQLQATLRRDLAEALRDVVGRAVDDAVARLRDGSDADGG